MIELIDNPFVCNIHYAFETPNNICCIMDFLGGGDLGEFGIREHLDHIKVKPLFAELVMAHWAFHEKDYKHGDSH